MNVSLLANFVETMTYLHGSVVALIFGVVLSLLLLYYSRSKTGTIIVLLIAGYLGLGYLAAASDFSAMSINDGRFPYGHLQLASYWVPILTVLIARWYGHCKSRKSRKARALGHEQGS